MNASVPSFSRFSAEMWPIILNALRIYTPYLLLPVTMTVGYVGYNLENWLHKNVENKVVTVYLNWGNKTKLGGGRKLFSLSVFSFNRLFQLFFNCLKIVIFYLLNCSSGALL